MANHKKSAPVHLSAEDRARMTRLFEEVSGRLEEMALITARNLGLGSSDLQPTFKPPESVSKTASGVQAELRLLGTTIVCSASDGCGCYDNDAGICYVC
jgi:hypothetical protein